MILRTTACMTALALVLAPAAAAHVTINPGEREAGGFARLAVRVPNERDNADTTRVQVKFPDEVLSASFQPVEGWTRTVRTRQLDPPIERDGEQITERIDTVTWSGTASGPASSRSSACPSKCPRSPAASSSPRGADVLERRARALDRPGGRRGACAVVTVLEGASEGQATAQAPANTATPEPAAAEDDGGTDTLSIIALVVGAAGLLAGGLALVRVRGPRRVAT